MKIAGVLAALWLICEICSAQESAVPKQQLSLLPIKPIVKKVETKPVEPIKSGTVWKYESELDPKGDRLVSMLTVSENGEKISFFSSLASGRLTAPEVDGVHTKINHYQFIDSFGNKGKLIIKPLSKDQIEVNFLVSEVSDPRVLMHYESQKYNIQAK